MSETMLSEIADPLDSIMPCPVCGKSFTGGCWVTNSERTDIELAMVQLSDSQRGRELLATCLRIAPLCDRCAQDQREQGERATRERARIHRLQVARAMTIKYGLWSEESQQCTFDKSRPDVEDRKPITWKSAREYDPDIKPNLFVRGDVGVGKTWFSRCILNACLERGFSVGEYKAQDIDSASWKWERGAEYLHRGSQLELVLLDDVDKATWTEKGISALGGLMDARYDRRKRTIMTSNLPVTGLSALLGLRTKNPTIVSALISRLDWPGLPHRMVELTGESLRQ